MRITITIAGGTVEITTPHNDPDRPVSPTYTGESEVVQILKEELSESYGHYGHILDPDNTTNLDLQAAIALKGKPWEVIEIEPRIEPAELPEGAIA